MGNTGSLIAKNDDVIVKKTYTKVALTEELKRRIKNLKAIEFGFGFFDVHNTRILFVFIDS